MYGSARLIDWKVKKSPGDPSIPAGATSVLNLELPQNTGYEAYLSAHSIALASITGAVAVIQELSYGDGTGYLAGWDRPSGQIFCPGGESCGWYKSDDDNYCVYPTCFQPRYQVSSQQQGGECLHIDYAPNPCPDGHPCDDPIIRHCGRPEDPFESTTPFIVETSF